MRRTNTKKFRINIMDIIVVLLAITCVVSIVLRSNFVKESIQPKEYRLCFQIDDIKSSSFAFFDGHEGENVRNKESGQVIGTLDAEFSRDIASYTYNDNGVEVKYSYPQASEDLSFSHERCSIIGYINLLGEMTNNGFMLEDGTILAENQMLEIVTEHIEVTIKVVSVEVK